MKSVATFIFALISIAAIAGEADTLKRKPVRYVFTVNSAVLMCWGCALESSSVALPTTIHGIQVKNWRFGAGVGFTSFNIIRAMPYFGSVSYNLYDMKKRRGGLFVEYNYGGAHAWLARPARDGNSLKDVDAWGFQQFSLGYAFQYEKLRLAAQAGFQRLSTIRRYQYGEPTFYPSNTLDYYLPPNQESVEYETNRFYIAISIGI